jgi:hypothetical protein
MIAIKPIPANAIPGALAKAERYRLLNEPFEAESICLDVLGADPANEQALVTLILALSDQFPQSGADGVKDAQGLLQRLQSDYDRAYYAGIICERWAKAQLGLVPPSAIYHWLRDALDHFERAAALAPADSADALLRWNSTARLLNQHPEMRPKASDEPGGEGYGWDDGPHGAPR